MTTTDYDAIRIQLADARDAFDTIDRLSRCDCPDTLPRNCFHFHFTSALRDLLIDRDATSTPDPNPQLANFNSPAYIYDFIRSLLALIDAAPYQTDSLSRLALDHSLCPMHFIDYAICFDDDDPDCAAIRSIFPDHDT